VIASPVTHAAQKIPFILIFMPVLTLRRDVGTAALGAQKMPKGMFSTKENCSSSVDAYQKILPLETAV